MWNISPLIRSNAKLSLYHGLSMGTSWIWTSMPPSTRPFTTRLGTRYFTRSGLCAKRVVPMRVVSNIGFLLSLNRSFRADDSFQDFMNTYSIVTSDGSVLWMFPAVMKTYCTLDVRHFPFDRQHCKIIFISWTFNGFKLNVTFNASEHQTVYYTPRNQVLTSLTPLLV